MAVSDEDKAKKEETSENAEKNHPFRYEIEARGLCYTLPKPTRTWLSFLRCGGVYECREILTGINCKATPGKLLAIAGPSGAGKSTLLELLAGKLRPSSPADSILVNSNPLRPSHVGKISAFVAQHDALLPLLTVSETVTFSAALRLRAAPPERRKNRLNEILNEMNLAHVAESRVKDLSGGERRRVSIAVEAIADPPVLFLDEPTSGLDSAAALQIIKMIKRMATQKNRTAILTIHQPGARILELIDLILLLCDGTCVHFGTVASLRKTLIPNKESLQHVNTLDYALDNLDLLVPHRIPAKLTLNDLFCLNQNREIRSETATDPRGCRTTTIEVAVLFQRNFKNVYRTKELFGGRMLQAALAGLCLGSIFHGSQNPQDIMGLLAFSLTFLMSGTTEGLPIFVQERPVLMRETYNGTYRVSSYVAASALVFLPFMLAISVAFAVPVYFLAGLTRSVGGFFYFVLVIWTAVYAANSVVAAFSAAVPDYIMGTTLITGCMGCFFLFSGFFVLKSEIPQYWMFVHYLSLFKYPLEALLVNEFGRRKGVCLEKMMGICVMDVQSIMDEQGLHEGCRWMNVLVILGFICFYRLLSYFLLRLRCSSRGLHRPWN